MSYNTPVEVMLGVFAKLNKQKSNLENKQAELTPQITLLNDYPESALYEKMEKDLEKTTDDLANVELQISLIQRKRNGKASLDKFLTDKTLSKVEKQMNEDYPDTDIKIGKLRHESDNIEGESK
jgi:hypothetical protein